VGAPERDPQIGQPNETAIENLRSAGFAWALIWVPNGRDRSCRPRLVLPSRR